MKKDKPFQWTSETQSALDQLLSAFTSAPTLTLPDDTKPYMVNTDVSDHAISTVLSQDQGQGLQPIAFKSRKLKGAELNYMTCEKEFLAIIHALKAWWHYLLGRNCTIVTNHHPLQYLNTQPTLSQ